MDRRIYIVAIVLAVVTSVAFCSVSSAETKKCSGTSIRLAVSQPGNMVIGDVPDHEMSSYSYTDVHTSNCAEWDGAVHMGQGFSDSIAGTGTHQGYYADIAKDGTRGFGNYSGKHEMTVKEDESWETTFKGTWEFKGGSGVFAGVKGRGTYRGRTTAEGTTYEWEGEVEVR